MLSGKKPQQADKLDLKQGKILNTMYLFVYITVLPIQK